MGFRGSGREGKNKKMARRGDTETREKGETSEKREKGETSGKCGKYLPIGPSNPWFLGPRRW